MKNRKRLLLFGMLALFLNSCGGFSPAEPPYDPSRDTSFGDFWALNTETGRFYRVDAGGAPLWEGRYCAIWAEKGAGISAETAKNMAAVYDARIYPNMIAAFGFTRIINGNEPVEINTMEYADGYLGNNDKKLCILLLDIKDSYRKGENGAYVAGYFRPYDFYKNPGVTYSNERDMIYIDTFPGAAPDNIEEAYTTVAHEMQHLMNFVFTSLLKRNAMDVWIDEGLSSAAEWVYSGEYSRDRLAWFNGTHQYSPYSLINKGNNFFVWENHASQSNRYPVLDDYATVNLFFQWLRLQAQAQNSGGNIYFDIIASPHSDFRAVSEAADKAMPGNDYGDWGTLLKTWLAANYVNAPDGKYGYADPVLREAIRTRFFPGGTTSVSLFPGEAVYSKSVSPGPVPGQGAGTSIRYAGLTGNAPYLDESGVPANGALLTYNINTRSDGYAPAENGATTGIAADVNTFSGAALSRGVFPAPPSGPFPVSAGEMLRRNGQGDRYFGKDFSPGGQNAARPGWTPGNE